MNAIQEAEKLLTSMTRAEKALTLIVRDLGDAFPGIDANPDICGGEPCISTSIHTLEEIFCNGHSTDL
jgi:hypothetical protein